VEEEKKWKKRGERREDINKTINTTLAANFHG
jgi:hypothetical protein